MTKLTQRPAAKMAASAFILLAVSACSANGLNGGSAQPEFSDTGLGYHQQRYERANAAQSFQSCKSEGLEMDRLARQSGSSGQYLTSAEILAKCNAELGSAGDTIEEGEQMRVMALAAQNYANGGDIARARAALDSFKSTFRGRDLYFSDGSSWIQSFELALGMLPRTAAGNFSTTNANKTLKAEVRRSAYWLSN